ncbi:LytTR family DNA-binding domain-containing protein [Capnocytophaga sputigena]|uniref:LytR/AlgR family response regulator transcription factor n=1 Tax=Capnocytophaga sputigena TaxID=1019 RepID=UPI0028D6CBB7|nr:LytTR family DNA-binding domain-containing protein [Capnocytophaga sputigena]
MQPLTCIIVDDEPMALCLLESYVKKTPSLQLVGKFSNAIDVLQFLHSNPAPELIYMDIQMPELNGLQLSKKLPTASKIVFTTAFDQYALEGYKVNAIGYLLKPFDYSEFLETVEKALLIAGTTAPQLTEVPDYMFVKTDYKQVKVLYSDILYIESLKDYVRIYLIGDTPPITTLMSLKKLEEELPPEQFMRVHRSFIVALDKVEVVERNQIVFGKQRITIAEHCKEAFLRRLSYKKSCLNIV